MPSTNNRKPVEPAAKGVNEYIPSFISKKPFYVADDEDSTSDYLEHQRLQKSAADQAALASQRWYDRGRKLGPAATKFRKGACENCGAMTHKTKDCLSRPRKQGAKWTGKDIQADEVLQDVSLGWDAKRDRWNGYDAKEYGQVVEEYTALEEMKRAMKGQAGGSEEKLIVNGEAGDEEGGAGVDDGAKYEEETDMGRQQSTSTRNLRLREDTAKYLLNLDLDSAKYDPKTRSMVDSGATQDQAAALVAEEGFMRASGDAAEFDKATRYAWEMQERGDKNKIHLQANPTSGEYFRRKEKEENEAKKEVQKKVLLEKYGGREHLQKNPGADSVVVESERYVEYDERGAIKGTPKTKAGSQYQEDVMINNHTSVWGSWWRDFKWGYACCHLTIKNSYCTGEQGKKALEQTDRFGQVMDVVEQVPKAIAWQEETLHAEHAPNGVDKDSHGTADMKTGKRKLEEMRDGVNEMELDQYRRKRVDPNDPMARHLGRDELVH